MAGQEKRLLVIAVDPSEYAEYAFDWYVKYLHHPENEILAIHCPEGFDLLKAQKEISKGAKLKEPLEKQYSKITELEERYRHKIHDAKLKGTVLSVPCKASGQAILDAAHDENAFAIVMGTRGRSKLKKAIMGSVSDFVVKNADVPVIVVRKRTQHAQV